MEELSPTARLPADVEAVAQDASRRWGPYVILSELGRGASGVVNQAYDLRLHRRVALKTLLEMSPVQFERFAREARSAAKLEHPGIVRVLDLSLLNGRPCMAMEVVEGRSLRVCFREQSLRTRELVSILRDVAEALGHAHAQGIVHRDVKPGNIFVDSTMRGRIMDFGIARDTEADENLTSTGQTLGTPEYMSPEQASDPRSASPRSDVYSLGAVLFEGLTGRPPFLGSTPVETMFKVMSENLVRPSALGEVPMVLEEVILRCLDRDPAKRFVDGRELARSLDKFLAGRAAMEAKKLAAKKAAEDSKGDSQEGLEGAASPASARSLIAIGIGIGLIVSASLGWLLYERWKKEEKAKAVLREEKRREEEKRKAAEAEEQKKKQAAEVVKRREEAVARALATRDPKARIVALDACHAQDELDLRVLLGRAAARVDLQEDCAERNVPQTELAALAAKDIEAVLALDPGAGQAYIERARSAMLSGDGESLNRALAAAERTRTPPACDLAELIITQQRQRAIPLERSEELVRKHEGYSLAWQFRGQELTRAHRWKDAVAAYDRALALEDRPRLHSERLNVVLYTNDQDAIVAACNKWLETWPGTPMAYFRRGGALLAKNDIAGALEDSKRLLEMRNVVMGHELAGQAYVRKRDWDAALAESEALLREETGSPRARPMALLMRGLALEGKGDLEHAAQAVLEAGVTNDADVFVRATQQGVRIALRFLSERGDPAMADDVLRHVGEMRARTFSVSLQRIRVNMAAGDLGTARQLLAEAKALSANNPQAQGRIVEEEKLLEKCWQELRDHERFRPVDAAANRGDEAAQIEGATILASLGERDRARDEISRIASAASTDAVRVQALIARSRFIAESPEESLSDIARALALRPDDAVATAERGVHRARLSQEAAAKEDCAHAVALAAQDTGARAAETRALVHARRAEALFILGDIAGADAAVKESLGLDSRLIDALSIRHHIEARRGDRAGEAATLRALLPYELYSVRVEVVKTRIAWLERIAGKDK